MGKIGIRQGIWRFSVSKSGNVAIIFAVLLIPVSGIVAAAIDFGRAAKVRSTLVTAASAAAQAGSARLDQGRDAVSRQVHAMLAANLPEHLASLPHRLVVPRDLSSVEVSMEATVPTTLMGILGVRELTVEGAGFAKRPLPQQSPQDLIASGSSAVPPVEAEVARAVGALLGTPGPMSSSGAGFAMQPPGFGGNDGRAEIEQAARQLAEQLGGLRGPVAPGLQGGLPPEAAAEIERVMRDLGRSLR